VFDHPDSNGPICTGTEKNVFDKWRPMHFVNRTRMASIGLQIFLVVNRGTSMNETFVSAAEITGKEM
jgi:hypothetical protein